MANSQTLVDASTNPLQLAFAASRHPISITRFPVATTISPRSPATPYSFA